MAIGGRDCSRGLLTMVRVTAGPRSIAHGHASPASPRRGPSRAPCSAGLSEAASTTRIPPASHLARQRPRKPCALLWAARARIRKPATPGSAGAWASWVRPRTLPALAGSRRSTAALPRHQLRRPWRAAISALLRSSFSSTCAGGNEMSAGPLLRRARSPGAWRRRPTRHLIVGRAESLPLVSRRRSLAAPGASGRRQFRPRVNRVSQSPGCRRRLS